MDRYKHIIEEELPQLEAVVRAASQSEWNWGRAADVETVEGATQWAADCLRKSDNPQLWVVHFGDPDDPKVVALTGNGPTSEANARYISATQPQVVLALIDLIRDMYQHIGGAE